jgi:hypothetical protein
MTEVHCTLKFSKRVPFVMAETDSPCTNGIGPWCANIFNLGRIPMVILTNEKTLLSVIVQFKNVSSLWDRSLEAVEILLHSIALPSSVIQREINEMQSVSFSRKKNRQVLGSMNDFVFLSRAYFESNPSGSLEELSFELSGTPCSPLKYAQPRHAALSLFTPPATGA